MHCSPQSDTASNATAHQRAMQHSDPLLTTGVYSQQCHCSPQRHTASNAIAHQRHKDSNAIAHHSDVKPAMPLLHTASNAITHLRGIQPVMPLLTTEVYNNAIAHHSDVKPAIPLFTNTAMVIKHQRQGSRLFFLPSWKWVRALPISTPSNLLLLS